MRSFLFLMVVGFFVVYAYAQTTNKLSVAERRARRQARIEARIAAEGGMVVKPNTGSYARILCGTTKVDSRQVKVVVDKFNVGLNIWFDIKDVKLDIPAIEFARREAKRPKTGFLLVVVDDATLPMTLSAYEEGWAIMNVRPLGMDFPPKGVYNQRIQKQINRSFAQAAGAGLSFNKPCVMEPVFSLVDLDRIKYPVISPEVMSKVLDVCAKRDVQSIVSETYLEACRAGWAAAPTNELQKTIWERSRSLPDKPIKIKYDASRDALKK